MRTYILFKDFGSAANFLTMPMSFLARKSLAMFRSSNLALRLETGRFERPRLKEEERICPACEEDRVENEEHAMFFCLAYSEMRRIWLESLDIPQNFNDLELSQKFKIVLNESSNVKSTAQFTNLLLNFITKEAKL